jgi:hypothetical protein
LKSPIILILVITTLSFFIGCRHSEDDAETTTNLPAPANLQAVFADGIVSLSWEDNSTREEGFCIEKMIETEGTYREIAFLGENSTSFSDPDWSYSNHLSYRIRITASYTYSDYSNVAEITMPDFESWRAVFGGSGMDRIFYFHMTSGSGYIGCGLTKSTDGDITGSNGGVDVLVVKLKFDGEIEWIRSIGGTGDDIALSVQEILTRDNKYILCGRTTSSNSGDVQDINNGGSYDFLVMQLDSNGNHEWDYCIGDSGGDKGQDLYQTRDVNGFYDGYIIGGIAGSISGDFIGNHGLNDAAIVKLGPGGNIEWSKSIGGLGNDSCLAIQQTQDYGYIVVGGTMSGAGSGDITDDNNGLEDFLIIKLDITGNITWQKSLGGTSSDTCYSIRQTPDNGYIAGGKIASNDRDVSGNHGGYDAWIVKLDSEGNIQWQKCIGGSGNDYCNNIS